APVRKSMPRSETDWMCRTRSFAGRGFSYGLFLLIMGLALLWTPQVPAQVEQATITGTVSDTSGAVVPNAQVAITNVQTQVTVRTETNAVGHYRVPYLYPGLYEVTVESPGFRKARVSDVNLTVGLTATLNVTLQPGSLQQEVTVTAGAVPLEQQTA